MTATRKYARVFVYRTICLLEIYLRLTSYDCKSESENKIGRNEFKQSGGERFDFLFRVSRTVQMKINPIFESGSNSKKECKACKVDDIVFICTGNARARKKKNISKEDKQREQNEWKKTKYSYKIFATNRK